MFREFCMERRDQLTGLVSTRRVQTNEVRRCCYLLPAIMLAATMAARPLALIETGASAGLNLGMDHYAYDYGTGTVICARGPARALSPSDEADSRRRGADGLGLREVKKFPCRFAVSIR